MPTYVYAGEIVAESPQELRRWLKEDPNTFPEWAGDHMDILEELAYDYIVAHPETFDVTVIDDRHGDVRYLGGVRR